MAFWITSRGIPGDQLDVVDLAVVQADGSVPGALLIKHLLALSKSVRGPENDLPVAYANYKIYSSVPGEFFVRMKFMIPCTDEKQANILNKNMTRVKDYIFTNISSDTEIGDSFRQMKWHRLKELLLEAVNDHSNNPVDTIYFQEAIILKSS